jgi:hypothetical protein
MMRCHAAEFGIVQDYAHAREVVRADRRPWCPIMMLWTSGESMSSTIARIMTRWRA